MKFISLEILNLASLDRTEGERIDFEEGALGKSSIFSIVGPTGSGKSTLLDAICLALYGRAPRYPRKKGERDKIAIYGTVSKEEENRPAPTDCCNILTKGKKSGYSKLTFKANDGIIYRAEWSVRFKQKTFENPETHLYKLQSGGDVVECEWKSIPQIIGLDYEQFLRTVLIAQGTFANFLNSSEDDRYKLLEKLIGCEDLYKDIANRIKQEYSAANTEYIRIDTTLSTVKKDFIEEPELGTLKERVAQLEQEEKEAKAELGKLTKAIEWYNSEEKQLEEIKTYREKLTIAQQNLTDYKPLIDRLSIHDATTEPVKYCLDHIGNQEKTREIEVQLKTLWGKIEAAKNEIATNVSELSILMRAAKDADDELQNQKPHINKARTIKTELVSLENTFRQKRSDKETSERVLNEANKAVTDNDEKIKGLKSVKNDAERALENTKYLTALERKRKEEAVTNATGLFNAKADEIKEIDAITLQKASNRLRDKRNDIAAAIRIRKEIAEKREMMAKYKAESEKLAERNREIGLQVSEYDIEAMRREIGTLKNTHTLMTSKDWQAHRVSLVDGEACPLCGSTEHPYKNSTTFAPVVTELGRLIEEKTTILGEVEERIQSLNNERSQNNGKISVLIAGIRTLTVELEKLRCEWTSIHERYPDWPEGIDHLEMLEKQAETDAKGAEEALSDYNKKAREKEELRLLKEKAEKEFQEYNKECDLEIEKARIKVTDAENALSTEEGRTQILINQQTEKTATFNTAKEAFNAAQSEVNEKKQQLKAELGDKDPDQYEKQLEKGKNDADERVKEKENVINELKKELSGFEGQVKTTEQLKIEEQLKENSNKTLLDNWLVNFNASHDPWQHLTVEKIKEISSYADDWERLRDKKEELLSALTSARTTLLNAEKEHEVHQVAKPEKDKASLTDQKTELERRANHELVALQARMQRHIEAANQMGSVLQELQSAKKKRDAWYEINEAIGSEGKTLRKIAQCYTLRFLVEHANSEIRKFNSRYELQQVRNSLGIRVIDHDRGDDVRDTTSLSGGETFIVSLGLALGLSSLSSRSISFENLFVDEGFGTLDPDTLGTVIDSLAMLQSSQGKKVGVISHTDAMFDRIGTQIRVVRRRGRAGSSYIEIYPDCEKRLLNGG